MPLTQQQLKLYEDQASLLFSKWTRHEVDVYTMRNSLQHWVTENLPHKPQSKRSDQHTPALLTLLEECK
eukprot:1706651-Prorocentrum_lima.AAC.1